MILAVLIRGAAAGTVDLVAKGGPVLQYDRQYRDGPGSVPLTVLAPLAAERFSGKALRKWLEGLLPDDRDTLRKLRSRYRVSGADPLLLLGTAMGADCAGAAQFCPVDHADRLAAQHGGADQVSPGEIAAHLRRLRTDPADRTWDRAHPDSGFSLAGMQPKVALAEDGSGGWAAPWGSRPTTHIVKATRAGDYPHEAVVEHVTMEAARLIGIPAAATRVGEFDGDEVIIVERFDRRAPAEGPGDRIHQEDLCQAAGKSPAEKYQRDGGPTPEQAARLFRGADPDRAGANIARFADQLIYQWCTVSNDGHAKNYSISHPGGGQIHLTPAYDVASWLPYRDSLPSADVRLAMKIGGDYAVGAAARPGRLARFADSLGMDASDVIARAGEIAAAVPDALKASIDALPPGFADNEQIDKLNREAAAQARWAQQVAARAADAEAARRKARSGAHTQGPVESLRPAQAPPLAQRQSARCAHYGVRSGKRCVRPPHRDSDHRYS